MKTTTSGQPPVYARVHRRPLGPEERKEEDEKARVRLIEIRADIILNHVLFEKGWIDRHVYLTSGKRIERQLFDDEKELRASLRETEMVLREGRQILGAGRFIEMYEDAERSNMGFSGETPPGKMMVINKVVGMVRAEMEAKAALTGMGPRP